MSETEQLKTMITALHYALEYTAGELAEASGGDKVPGYIKTILKKSGNVMNKKESVKSFILSTRVNDINSLRALK